MNPWLDDGDVRIHLGDVLDVLPTLPDASVDCCVTSPPYWGLRDYGTPGQLGLESTPDEYVARMVAVFREVRRVLTDHGTCWVNLGDSYNNRNVSRKSSHQGGLGFESEDLSKSWAELTQEDRTRLSIEDGDLKEKDLVGVPWMVAFALRADGWYLRSDIVWAKPNPMPESVRDRPTKSHEYVFLLSKRPRYWFDAEAVRERVENVQPPRRFGRKEYETAQAENGHRGAREVALETGQGTVKSAGNHFGRVFGGETSRNVRSVWQIATQPYAEAHFATYPEELVRRCLLAGCPTRVCRQCGRPSERIVEREPSDWQERKANGEPVRHGLTGAASHGARGFQGLRIAATSWSDCGHNAWRPGVVLDPFLGSGTTAKVARDHGRHTVGIELNETYARLSARRLQQLSLLAEGIA